MRLSTQSLARSSSRRPWRTIGLWVVAVVMMGAAISALLNHATTHEANFTNNPEAKQANTLLEKRLHGPERDTEILIVSSPAATVDEPTFRSYVQRLQGAIEGLGRGTVLGVGSYYQAGDPALVARDRHTTILPTVMAGSNQEAADKAPKLRRVITDTRQDGFRTQLFGPGALNDDFNKVSQEDLKSGESIGIMAALIVLVVVFGAVVAAFLPILVGIAAIGIAIGAVAIIGQLWSFSFFVTNMITMMGLAVGIDYSLFVTSRYREERRRGVEKLDAIEAAGATASRAVLFS